MNTSMMSPNAYIYPSSGVSVPFTSPLMDCTSAIHNSDNIQNGSPYFMTTKSNTSAVFQERLKGMPLIVEEPQSPVLPKRHTNDPYRKTSVDGSPCVPKSPYSPEVNFFMSYKDDEASFLEPSSLTPIRTHPVAASRDGSGVRGSVNTIASSASASASASAHHLTMPLPRSNGTFTHSVYDSPPYADGSPSASAFRYTPTVTETPTASHNNTKRVESRYMRSPVSIQPCPAISGSTASASTTSVTHVRCKRVYVNGRPVTVWLNEDNQAQ